MPASAVARINFL
jgi:hypothetical protein